MLSLFALRGYRLTEQEVARTMDAEQIRAALTALRQHDLPTHGGRTLAYVYDSGLAEADAIGREALAAYGSTNALDPTAFPSLLQMEQDLIADAAVLLDGPPGTVGTVTSGGTESILLAVQAARDAHPEITRPTMVLPTSAHGAFHKAAHYFGVRPVFVEVDPDDRPGGAVGDDRGDRRRHGAGGRLGALVRARGGRPGDPDRHRGPGGRRALPRGRLHRRLAAAVPAPRRPRAAGVLVPGARGDAASRWTCTSTASPRRASRSCCTGMPALRRPQFFATADWPGYTMINSTMQSTKSGGPLAAAWAVTRMIGDEGYLALARRVRDGQRLLVDAVSTEFDHLRVLTAPDASLVALAGDARASTCSPSATSCWPAGWYAQPQLSFGPFPATLHVSISPATEIEEFIDALRGSEKSAAAVGPVRVDPGVAALLADLDPAALDDAAFDRLLALAGLADEGGLVLPERMAPVNALLDAAPTALREQLVTAFVDRLSRPRR